MAQAVDLEAALARIEEYYSRRIVGYSNEPVPEREL
jgi:hypothetical protein